MQVATVATTRRRRCRRSRPGPGSFRKGRVAGISHGVCSRPGRSGSRPPPAPIAAASSGSGGWFRTRTAFLRILTHLGQPTDVPKPR